MSQYAYILVLISLVVLFLINKYEKEKLQKLLQEQLLTENINDVIADINKSYRLGLILSKEITDQLK